MKITGVETILLTGPCILDPYILEFRIRRSAAFIRIATDEGVTGLGETYAGYFIPEPIPDMVEFFAPILAGRDPDEVEALWARMYQCGNFWCRVGLGAAVLAGIDAALWDLRGKKHGLPVYKLLAREYGALFKDGAGFAGHARVPVYASGGGSNYPLDKLARKLEFYFDAGYRNVKLGAGAHTPERGFFVETEPAAAAAFEAEKSEFLRRRFGDGFGLFYDGHMGNSPAATWDLETAAAVLRAVEPYNVGFYEEPLHYTRPDWYGELRKRTATPVAGGECLATEAEWREFMDHDAFAVGQPDASYTSSLSACMRIAARLSHRGGVIATHSWGAGGSLMQNVHLGFACPNIKVVETAAAYAPLHTEVMGDSFRMADGHLSPPEKPGLGVELPSDFPARYPFVRGSGEFNNVPGKRLEDERC